MGRTQSSKELRMYPSLQMQPLLQFPIHPREVVGRIHVSTQSLLPHLEKTSFLAVPAIA